MMRLVKAESLRKEIDILSQSHERDVDRKDAILQMLDRDLEEAEDQYQLASKIRQLNRETEERNRLLREEKNSIQHHYQQLKQRIQIYRGTQNQRLLQLSQSANSCKEIIQEKLDQAKRILQLSEYCRKLETMEEQILPFVPIDDDTIKEEQTKRSNQSAIASHKTAVLNDNGSFVPSSDRLTNFHRRLNKVVIDNIAISKEKDRLINENSQLEDLIQQYLDGTKVNENTLNADNPLLVVNGRANLNHIPPVRKVKPLVQDGLVIQNTIQRQHQSTRY
eukprot:gene17816-23426_t